MDITINRVVIGTLYLCLFLAHILYSHRFKSWEAFGLSWTFGYMGGIYLYLAYLGNAGLPTVELIPLFQVGTGMLALVLAIFHVAAWVTQTKVNGGGRE